MSERNNIKIFGSEGQQNQENIPEALLMAYLEGKLSPEEQREIEARLSTENMESDAVEGLQILSVEDTKNISNQLNAQLQQTLKNKRKRRRGLPDQKWSWVAVVVVLLLIMLAFAVLFMAKKAH